MSWHCTPATFTSPSTLAPIASGLRILKVIEKKEIVTVRIDLQSR
jgi:hypothetical protein